MSPNGRSNVAKIERKGEKAGYWIRARMLNNPLQFATVKPVVRIIWPTIEVERAFRILYFLPYEAQFNRLRSASEFASKLTGHTHDVAYVWCLTMI